MGTVLAAVVPRPAVDLRSEARYLGRCHDLTGRGRGGMARHWRSYLSQARAPRLWARWWSYKGGSRSTHQELVG